MNIYRTNNIQKVLKPLMAKYTKIPMRVSGISDSIYYWNFVLLFLTFPIAIIEKSLPFGGFLLFIILFAGLARNPNVPYFVRYNACQALLIDIALIIISYLLRIFPIVELGSIIFIFTLCIFIYSISQCIFGVEPEIPLISKSVRMQI